MIESIDTLPYNLARNKIKSGDILLCSGKSEISRMIQDATDSKWSHVAFVIWIDCVQDSSSEAMDQHLVVMESVESIGVRMMPFMNYLKNYNGSGERYNGDLMICRHEKFDLSNVSRLVRAAYKFVGNPYNKSQLLRILEKIGMWKFGFRGEDLTYKDEFICSEYVHECFREIGIEIPYNREGYIAPADYYLCSDISKMMIIS